MEIRTITKDSLRYPFSNWKKVLILGIIILFSGISGIVVLLDFKNVTLISFLIILGVVIGFLVNGYLFKVLKSSLKGTEELPKFNNWIDMFVNGIKINIISIFYNIPTILILLIFSGLSFTSDLVTNGTSQFSIDSIIVFTGIDVLSVSTKGWAVIAILYMTVIYPISLMATANMAQNSNKLNAAFHFREIFHKISNIGWGNLIQWYIVIGVIYYIILLVVEFGISSITGFQPSIIATLIYSLILTPYLAIYIYRSLALFCISNQNP